MTTGGAGGGTGARIVATDEAEDTGGVAAPRVFGGGGAGALFGAGGGGGLTALAVGVGAGGAAEEVVVGVGGAGVTDLPSFSARSLSNIALLSRSRSSASFSPVRIFFRLLILCQSRFHRSIHRGRLWRRCNDT